MEKPTAMESIQAEMADVVKMPRISTSLAHVDGIIQLLSEAKEKIAATLDPHTASLTMTKLQNPAKVAFDTIIGDDFKKATAAHKKLGKALDKHFPPKPLPSEHDAMANHQDQINRAIAMHFLREGQFNVASTFIDEAQEMKARNSRYSASSVSDSYSLDSSEAMDEDQPEEASPTMTATSAGQHTSEMEGLSSLQSQELQNKFSEMYNILQELRARNLLPAIEWARVNAAELEARGSNLEFELIKYQYIWLFKGPAVNGLPDDENNGQAAALRYARNNFGRFQARHLRELDRLAGAMAYAPNIPDSPYRQDFAIENAFSTVATSFTREFCSLLGLSAESPLYIAATAGTLALPQLVKYIAKTRSRGTEWTSANELPFETPLPRRMMYHSIFVCPVLKGQTTETNPPVILPCGHVLAQETLHNLLKGQRFKCPYCPSEAQMKDTRLIIL
ncbi:protein RMD5 A [Echria macrotheca]|uniref:GID complex catalytic subunit 2 n=1 Tax=Echria macrotheca TaxID=438768 RepID=A0AAJ0B8T0_9PEZI|nr:protein RMD5 A [Echria macrotheca]